MLTQSEADALLAMDKRFIAEVAALSVAPGVSDTYELIETGGEERFLLDLGRGRRRVAKLKFQTRARNVYILARLDIEGTPHTNPDGQRLGGTHLHLYREGFEARWAYPLDSGTFDTTSAPAAFRDFCAYCHIRRPPTLQESLL